MKLICWILEYLLIIQRQIATMFAKPPECWAHGNKDSIVIIPGYSGHHVFLRELGDLCNTLGYKVHVFKEHDPVGDINEQVEKLRKQILLEDIHNIILLTHSRGGVITKLLIDKYEDINCRVKKVIAISTPWKGSLLGHVPFKNMHQLKPTSENIKVACDNKSNLNKIINIYGSADNHVIPNRNLILEGAENHQIDVVGHTRILTSDKTLNFIRHLLSELQ